MAAEALSVEAAVEVEEAEVAAELEVEEVAAVGAAAKRGEAVHRRRRLHLPVEVPRHHFPTFIPFLRRRGIRLLIIIDRLRLV
ncbi:hypothetical protein PanWU01x14_005250 [Parasponia andersonii]|uniref:Uncharacterized protein n=1 Tax=Parasponia andersonii TaxID=3476 RepID=A0A2P5E3G2_PARAD|nr:hypothetical protein PanWU01x14_005250 [Parasponia andersonii]